MLALFSVRDDADADLFQIPHQQNLAVAAIFLHPAGAFTMIDDESDMPVPRAERVAVDVLRARKAGVLRRLAALGEVLSRKAGLLVF